MDNNLQPQLTTLSLFGVKKGNLRWGLAQMQTSVPVLNKTPGLLFYKLLGSGHGKGFSLKPNFYRYGLICTWQNEEAADAFLQQSALMQDYKERCFETWTVKLQPFQAHGLWDGLEPFKINSTNTTAGPLAVLTRASINWRALPSFWRFVPQTSKALDNASGLICSIGLGELPFIRQATFSVWESAEAMKSFAYQNAAHQEVIKRTRSEKWYSEELFARFSILSVTGTWNGFNPLAFLDS